MISLLFQQLHHNVYHSFHDYLIDGKGNCLGCLVIISPFSIAIKVKREEETKVISQLMKMELPPRIRTILYVVKKKQKYYNDFPVNLLRNIAIVNIQTSHYVVFDMDMWPACFSMSSFSHIDNLYKEALSIPPSVYNSPTSVTIVPAFFLDKKPILANCTSLLSCALQSEAVFPTNKRSMMRCLKQKQCLLYKENTVTHVQPSHYL